MSSYTAHFACISSSLKLKLHIACTWSAKGDYRTSARYLTGAGATAAAATEVRLELLPPSTKIKMACFLNHLLRCILYPASTVGQKVKLDVDTTTGVN